MIAKRYEKTSTIITTNKPLSKWAEIFGDPILANAKLDRLLHHDNVINIIGKSYRTRDYITDLRIISKKSILVKNFAFKLFTYILTRTIFDLLTPI